MRSLLLLTFSLVTACEKPPPAARAPSSALVVRPARPILGQDARALVSAGATLLDVRTVDEFRDLHLPGATNVPLHLLGGALGSLSKEKPIIVYCAVGSRSASAAGLLASAGFEVHNLGAMGNWEQ